MSPSASFIRILSAIALIVLALDACGDSTPTASAVHHQCGTPGAVALNVLQAAVIDCSSGSVIQLTGGGAQYLVVPEFATGDVTNRPTTYTLSDTDALAPVAQVGATRAPFAAAGLAARLQPGASAGGRQIRFDLALRAAERAAYRDGRWRRESEDASNPHARAAIVTPSAALPPVGSIRTFHVISTFDVQNPAFKAVNAKLNFIGTNTLVYVDTLSPPNGFTPGQLDAFGRSIDQTFYPIDVNAFGPPSDIDENGRVIVLLTPVVNALTPAAQCQSGGYISGFFDGFDLSSSSSSSNHGEIYYGLVPDPDGTVSCPHTVSSVLSIAPGTFLHEVQHMISYAQHVVIHNGSPEEGWLDEGLSVAAQELGSLYYERKFPPPTGRTDPSQLLPDSAEPFIADVFVEAYNYLVRPDTTTLTLHSDADGGLRWRAGDWLLAHWLGDQKGLTFYKRLDQSTLTGTANIAANAGEPFQSLFGDFGLALFTDSIPGVPKSAIPQRDRFTTRTLRTIFQAVFNGGGVDPNAPGPFPIAPLAIAGTISATMVPGTVSYYALFTSSSVPITTLRFAAPSGGQLPRTLHPQVSIFRLK
jgi:hypothetical protein